MDRNILIHPSGTEINNHGDTGLDFLWEWFKAQPEALQRIYNELKEVHMMSFLNSRDPFCVKFLDQDAVDLLWGNEKSRSLLTVNPNLLIFDIRTTWQDT